VTAPLVRKKVDRPPRTIAASNNAIKLAAEGTTAYASRLYDQAIAKYEAALAEWSGHHFAWYGLAACYIGKVDWAHAVDAISNAVTLAPDQPMYLMVYGVSLYEQIMAAERENQARRENRDAALVTVDASTLDFTKALSPLLRAVQLEPKLWRAHYYIGRIYRDGGFSAAAAKAFREAIAGGASTTAPFVALVEVYRRWGFAKEASEVALLGTARFQGVASADVWYELGMSYFDQRERTLAIQAFTQALAADPANGKALYQRGQTYFELKDKKRATADLDAFVKLGATDAPLRFARQQAIKMLTDLGAR
jgi:tetratricopeptide (TPR) repeat protein